jgi:ferric-dicitrate binding protein FerR (iron transport regulator)
MIEQPDKPDLGKQEEKALRIAYLISGYIRHTLTAEEHDELDEWVGESDANMRLFEEVTDEALSQRDIEFMAAADKQPVLNRLKGQLNFSAPTRRGFFSRIWQYAVAAAVVLILGTALFWLSRNRNNETTPSKLAVTEKQDVQPVYDQATLTLGDGRVFKLDEAQNGILDKNGNTAITKENGKLSYNTTEKEVLFQSQPNTLVTRGGSYLVTLSDGTRAWLNSASSMTYPAVFTGNERRVAISGEVYFEVASAKAKGPNYRKPFIVDVKEKDMTVEVLGTHFNINSYDDESLVKTTLLEGAVKVSTKSKTSFLKPDQQAQVSSTGNIQTISDVDIMTVTAWKDGMFRFRNHDIRSIMKQISRWYDVEVEFAGNQSNTGYNCILPRNLPVSKILEVLVETGGVHFEIEGKKIKVLP